MFVYSVYAHTYYVCVCCSGFVPKVRNYDLRFGKVLWAFSDLEVNTRIVP
jgi:hypothetical protein